MKKSSLLSLTLAGSFLLLSACGGAKDIDKIADAQACLDNAAPAQASECVAKVDGIESEGANLIRCVGKFVKEGFNQTDKIATAVSQLSSGGNGANGSLAMMAALAFKSESTTALNSSSAQQVFSYCTLAKAKGLILLSGLVQTSTALAYIAGGNLATLDGDALKAIMADPTVLANPEAQAAVGGAIVGIYNSSCGTGQTSTGNFCEQFASAVAAVPGGTSNVNGIGQQIMTCYANPAAAGCSGFTN